ncbi:tol-pal system YbgF family protein [Pendulispora albinea]|uniref:Tetratricopeptide repeat protein n=1 Tax=Pendulispora albinea TaxID=2741071 RepID=A0ABZ2LKT5_9BACT
MLASSLVVSADWASAAGVDPSKATPVQREQAQSRFLKGRKLYDARNYAGAAEEFRASHDIVASPNSLLFLARSLRQKGDLVAAYVEFDKARVEAKELARDDVRYEKAGEAAQLERDALTGKLGFVIVDVEHPTDETTLKIAGDTMRRAGWGEPAPVLPGTTQIEVSTPGRPPVTTSVTVAAGQTERTRLDVNSVAPLAEKTALPPPPPASDDRSTLRTAAYVAGGVGAAGFLTFIVFGLLNNGTYGDLESACGKGPCPASRSGDIDKGKSQQTIANVGLVFGLLGAGAGVTLFVLSQPRKGDAAGAPSTSTRPRPQGAWFTAPPRTEAAASDGRTRIVFGPTGVEMRGTF